MKKVLACMLLACVWLLAGCQTQAAVVAPQTAAPELSVVEITEKMFIAQCNDVYLNPDDYQGKAVRLEGIYEGYMDEESGRTYHYIIRYGPGCCGYDGSAGFEFLFDGEIPKLNDWIEVVGTVEKVKENDAEYVVLQASKVTVLDVRGAEFVSN